MGIQPGGEMQLQAIRGIAREQGVPGRSRLSKPDLIRAIQRHEGNFDCFGTAREGYCDQTSCLWLGDCLQSSTRG